MISLGDKKGVMRLLGNQDRDALYELQEKVAQSLDDPSRLQKLTTDEINTIIDQKLFAGVWESEKLVAARAFLVPPPNDPEHLALDAHIPNELWPQVIYSEISLVDPDVQGFGLQRQMGEWWMEQLTTTPYRYVCATVAPFNIPSLKDKFSLGMHIIALKEKYGGKMRYVFLKDFQNKVEEAFFEDIPMADIKRQQQLLKQGYVGLALLQKDSEWVVRYSHYPIS